MTYRLIHEQGDYIRVAWGDRPLFTYVYMPKTAAIEAPRPYFHPIHTLDGDVVTIFRPHDHRWHHGMSFVLAHVNGENFWGGVTYVHGQGYIQLDNVGHQRHDAWELLDSAANRAEMVERLTWIAHTGDPWISEQRSIMMKEVNEREKYWAIELGFRLKNIWREPLEIGSPTTQGRPKAGYGGLFWRGVRDFTGGQILMSDGRSAAGSEDDIIGERSRWLAFVGQHDGVDRASTMVFIDDPTNIRHPTQWFTRTGNFACASTSFMFDKIYKLLPSETLDLTYRVVVGSGAWSRHRIEEIAGKFAK